MSQAKTTHIVKIDIIQAIQELLQKHAVGTQEEICEVLQKQGIIANQVKVSRVLQKLGAIKINEDNKTVYRLPLELATVTPQDSIKHLILNIVRNEYLIIIQTTPGSAQLIARLLDQKKLSGILGTIAGDDTLFITPISIKHIQKLHQQIQKFLLN